MDEQIIDLIKDVAALKVSVASIEEKIDDLCHRLLGNGRPGLIADLQSTDRVLAEKIEDVEKRSKWLAGIWVGASSAVMGLFAVLKFILHI